MDFRLDFKPSVDSREREVIFIDNLPSIFEDRCNIVVINSLNVLGDLDTDRNEVILINTESTSIS